MASYILTAVIALFVGYFLGTGMVLWRAARSAKFEQRLHTYIADLIPHFRT